MREHAIVKYIHRDHTGYHGHHEFQVKMEHVERTNAATYWRTVFGLYHDLRSEYLSIPNARTAHAAFQKWGKKKKHWRGGLTYDRSNHNPRCCTEPLDYARLREQYLMFQMLALTRMQLVNEIHLRANGWEVDPDKSMRRRGNSTYLKVIKAEKRHSAEISLFSAWLLDGGMRRRVRTVL